MTENKIDKIVEQHRDADVDAAFDEAITEAITDADYPEPAPKINQAVKLGAMLSDLMRNEEFVGLIGISVNFGKPSVHVSSEYFDRHLADNWTVTTRDLPEVGCVRKTIDFEPCEIFCMEKAEFVRRDI